MNDTKNEHVPPFVQSDDLPGPHEFPEGDVGDQLRVAKVAEHRRKELLKQHERKENPGDTMRRIMKESARIEELRPKPSVQTVFVAEAKPDPVHHEFDRREDPSATLRKILSTAKPK